MPFTTRQIGPCFAAEVEGLDLRESLSPSDVAAIHAAMDEHAVLVFHAQHLTDEQHLTFSRGLGQLEDRPAPAYARRTITACPRPSPTCPTWTRTNKC